ncbi:iron-binding protein [Glugoides intestinalis]
MSKIQKIDSKYTNDVIDHFNNPRNIGSFENDYSVGTGIVGAPACGDVLKFQIKVNDKKEIVDARFKAFGCGSAIASSSLATELVKGKSIEDSLKINNQQIAQKLSLPPIKLHCSMLAEDAIKSAIKDYKLKNSL